MTVTDPESHASISETIDLKQGGDIAIKAPKLWSPDTPFLYTLKVVTAADEVESYVGMRKISLGKDEKGITRILLNNQFVFQYGPLDQGFWPDGLYTAPTDEALKYDLEVTKKLGFNMVRKHVKVEPAMVQLVRSARPARLARHAERRSRRSLGRKRQVRRHRGDPRPAFPRNL